ncbi:aminomethyl transferase family protein [Pararhodobacter zhoushanensis]|uniref:Aminomethyl transferase family protein n=1 Tax=Pararhodobacter zhoushanensis TaxID=2479545 RepID=A0ABT3GXN8_9RHOB|nr:aminomethyl transferase family protein [Pararhodobacter zhoushanensis]MCW1932286.1 aminomethyl transferase family protein [Pararhodobacter zhoushanensis]
MTAKTLQNKIDQAGGDLIGMLRNSPTGFYQFPVPSEWTNWRDEQRAWGETVVLFDQSYHMTDIYLSGPDVRRLLAETSINNYTDFPVGKAFQYVATSPDGYCIGDAIGFHLADGRVNIVGKPTAPAWLIHKAKTGGYDVDVVEDTRVLDGGKQRQVFRLQLQGPNALKLIEKLNGGPLPETRPFGMCDFAIAGVAITGLRHGMAGAPGMEFWGDYGQKGAVVDAILKAGEEFGLRRGGARTYSSSGPQSGWVGALLPAIYSQPDLRAFREALSATSYEATLSQGGSFVSDRIEDFYMDPWDLGYNRLIHWDHDFIGRDALLARKEQTHRKKIWLHWNDDDARRVLGSLLGDGPRYKYMEWPSAMYASCPLDRVSINGTPIGKAVYAAYTVHVGSWFSVGIIDEDKVDFGSEAVLTWGEPVQTGKSAVEPHEQTEIRVTMRKTALG